MKVHSCKCHKEPYTVCAACGCQHCTRYWRSCPRCHERMFGHHNFRANLVASATTTTQQEQPQ